MPTVLYVRREGETLVGQPAIQAYLADNRSRGPLTRQFQLLGIRVASSDPEQPSVEAHIYTDTHAPGRLFQALKTFLGDPLETATNVFGDAKGLEDLIALVLARVRGRAKELTGISPNAVTLGRPVRFIGDAGADERATRRLRAAAELAGFRDVRLVAEPIAAAHAADLAPGPAWCSTSAAARSTSAWCVVRRAASPSSGPRAARSAATARPRPSSTTR